MQPAEPTAPEARTETLPSGSPTFRASVPPRRVLRGKLPQATPAQNPHPRTSCPRTDRFLAARPIPPAQHWAGAPMLPGRRWAGAPMPNGAMPPRISRCDADEAASWHISRYARTDMRPCEASSRVASTAIERPVGRIWQKFRPVSKWNNLGIKCACFRYLTNWGFPTTCRIINKVTPS